MYLFRKQNKKVSKHSTVGLSENYSSSLLKEKQQKNNGEI